MLAFSLHVDDRAPHVVFVQSIAPGVIHIWIYSMCFWGPKGYVQNIHVRVSIDLRFKLITIGVSFTHLPTHRPPPSPITFSTVSTEMLSILKTWMTAHDSERQNLRHNDNDVDNDYDDDDHDNHQQGCSSPTWSRCCTSSTFLLDSRKRQSTARCIFDDKH